jgi:hypothetical protein
MKIKIVKGGPGSGDFNHEGRPGEVGGSAGDGGGSEHAGDNGKATSVSWRTGVGGSSEFNETDVGGLHGAAYRSTSGTGYTATVFSKNFHDHLRETYDTMEEAKAAVETYLKNPTKTTEELEAHQGNKAARTERWNNMMAQVAAARAAQPKGKRKKEAKMKIKLVRNKGG